MCTHMDAQIQLFKRFIYLLIYLLCVQYSAHMYVCTPEENNNSHHIVAENKLRTSGRAEPSLQPQIQLPYAFFILKYVYIACHLCIYFPSLIFSTN